LPDEITAIIFSLLPAQDVYRCGRVCRRLYALTDKATTWYARSEEFITFDRTVLQKHDLPSVGMRTFYTERFVEPTLGVLAKRKGPLCHALASFNLVPSLTYGAESYKILLIGALCVGKTALAEVFVSGRFSNEYDSTIDETLQKQIILDGETGVVEVLDPHGQEVYMIMRDQWYRECDGAMLVYDCTNTSSSLEMAKYHEQLLRVRDLEDSPDCLDGSTPLVMVANKSDLTSKVSPSDGSAFADAIGAAFFQTSAKEARNVNEAFEELVRRIRMRRRLLQGEALVQKKKTKRRRGGCIVQ